MLKSAGIGALAAAHGRVGQRQHRLPFEPLALRDPFALSGVHPSGVLGRALTPRTRTFTTSIVAAHQDRCRPPFASLLERVTST